LADGPLAGLVKRSKRARKLQPQLTPKERAQLREYKEIRRRAEEAFLRMAELQGVEVPPSRRK
jgi:hypothetical protein